jgi:uncharacterized protein YkwD
MNAVYKAMLHAWRSARRLQRFPIREFLLAVVLSLPSGVNATQPPPPPVEPSIDEPVSTDEVVLSPEYTGCGGQYPGVVNAAYEQEVVELVNAERSSQGLPPLKRVTLLDQAARYHAADMEQDDYFNHDSYDRRNGNLVYVCEWSDRVSFYYSGWNSLGENIASGYGSPQSVMAGWMGSSGHRANILSTSYREIGVGYYSGNQWVQDFGRRSSVYPIVINNEAAETDDRDVNLYIYGTTANWTEMRLRNNSLSWSGWMPFQNNLPWQLPDAVGTHTVTVEMRKGSTTGTSNDSIYLTTATTPELGNLPDSLSFLYSIADQRFVPESAVVTPLNVGNETTLTWQTSQSGTWFDAFPGTGSTPTSITITPQGSYSQAGTHNGSLTVTVTSPGGTLGSPHVIDLTLTVVEGEFRQVYFPSIVQTNP